jgi:hypothetical protein
MLEEKRVSVSRISRRPYWAGESQDLALDASEILRLVALPQDDV